MHSCVGHVLHLSPENKRIKIVMQIRIYIYVLSTATHSYSLWNCAMRAVLRLFMAHQTVVDCRLRPSFAPWP